MDGQNNLELGFINESVNLYNVDNNYAIFHEYYVMCLDLSNKNINIFIKRYMIKEEWLF